MKRAHIPLWVGVAGLMVMQAGCADSPTDPAWTGAPESLTQPEYLEVLVHNVATTRAAVSVELDGVAVEALGVLGAGASERFHVTSPVLAEGGPVQLVVISVIGSGRSTSEPLAVMAGWTIDVSITPAGPVASRAQDTDRTRY